MSLLRSVLKPGEFGKNVLTLFTGTFLSQLIPFMVLPVLQRFFYSPADFGLLALFVGYSEIFINIGSLKLEYAIVVKENLKKAAELAYTAFKVLLVIAGLSFIVSFFFYTSGIVDEFNRLGWVILLVPVAVAGVGINAIASYYFNRQNAFKTIASNKIIQSISAEGTKTGLGFLNTGSVGLIAGRITGQVLSGITLFRRFLKDLSLRGESFSSSRKISEVISENRQYVYFATPSVMVSAFINFTYLYLFFIEFGDASAGMIGVSMQYIGVALGMIAGAFSQVFFSKIAAITSRAEMMKTYRQFMFLLLLTGSLISLAIWIIPSSWVVYILGEKWSQLMDYARILSLWLCIWFVSSSLSFIYMRLEKQGFMLIMDILHFFMVPAGFYIGLSYENSPVSALWGFTIAQMLYYILAVLLALNFIRTSKLLK